MTINHALQGYRKTLCAQRIMRIQSTSNLFFWISLLTVFRNNNCQGKSVNSSQKQPNSASTYITEYNSEERQNDYAEDRGDSGIPWGDFFGSEGNDPEVTLTIYI